MVPIASCHITVHCEVQCALSSLYPCIRYFADTSKIFISLTFWGLNRSIYLLLGRPLSPNHFVAFHWSCSKILMSFLSRLKTEWPLVSHLSSSIIIFPLLLIPVFLKITGCFVPHFFHISSSNTEHRYVPCTSITPFQWVSPFRNIFSQSGNIWLLHWWKAFFVLQNTFPITSFIEPGKPLGSDVKILKLKANKKLSQNFSNCRNLSQPREDKTQVARTGKSLYKNTTW